MAITLRNKKVEEAIRSIGRRTGEGPSAVIARLAEAEEARLAAEKQRTYEERLARMRAFTATLPEFTDEDRAAARKDMDEMFDYLYDDKDEP
jgi:hypothetical protein